MLSQPQFALPTFAGIHFSARATYVSGFYLDTHHAESVQRSCVYICGCTDSVYAGDIHPLGIAASSSLGVGHGNCDIDDGLGSTLQAAY